MKQFSKPLAKELVETMVNEIMARENLWEEVFDILQGELEGENTTASIEFKDGKPIAQVAFGPNCETCVGVELIGMDDEDISDSVDRIDEIQEAEQVTSGIDTLQAWLAKYKAALVEAVAEMKNNEESS